jgi:hypothetical protein
VALRPRLATGLPLSSWLILVMPQKVRQRIGQVAISLAVLPGPKGEGFSPLRALALGRRLEPPDPLRTFSQDCYRTVA